MVPRPDELGYRLGAYIKKNLNVLLGGETKECLLVVVEKVNTAIGKEIFEYQSL